VRARAATIARATTTAITLTLATTNPAAPAHAGVKTAIRTAVDRTGLTARELPSGAGHDAQMIAALCPMGMIFVPSIGGISHSPKELTSWDDCTRGAQVLLETVLELDRRESV
jgi:N-carbamoyl-L-amino-acid hydrolase